MAALDAAERPEALYRIASIFDPDISPLTWPSTEYRARKAPARFDAPRQEYGVIYAGEQRLACFLEVLDRSRPELAALEEYERRLEAEPDLRVGYIPWQIDPNWCENRRIGTIRLREGYRFLDFRSAQTHETLRRELRSIVSGNGGFLDGSDATTRNYLTETTITRQVSLWARSNGYAGIQYKSRVDLQLDNWAIFDEECAEVVELTRIRDDDSDFLTAKSMLMLA